MSGRKRLWPSLLAASILTAAPRARADKPLSKLACIEAFDRAQKARRQGSLRRSREDLLLCAHPDCPAVVRADCAGVLREVDAVQPTIVLKAADASGNDLTDVVVELDGNRIATSLDGRPIAIDPGKLSLVFKRPPWKDVPVDGVIAEGEKDRIIRAELGPPLPPRPAPSLALAPLGPPPKRSAVGWAVPGGLVVLGGAALAFAGLTSLALHDDADSEADKCGHTCPDRGIDPLRSRLSTANVALVVGLGSLALAAITWFVLAPQVPPARAAGLR